MPLDGAAHSEQLVLPLAATKANDNDCIAAPLDVQRLGMPAAERVTLAFVMNVRAGLGQQQAAEPSAQGNGMISRWRREAPKDEPK